MTLLSINSKHSEKITAALQEINGRATAHTFTHAQDIIDIADAATSYLRDLGLSKTGMKGAVVRVTSGGDVPKAYRWRRNVNVVTLTRRPSHWYLTSVVPTEIWGSAPGPDYFLTREQDEVVAAKARSRYQVKTGAVDC